MKEKKPANPFLKKASGVKPPTRSAIKSQQRHGGLGRVGRGLDSLIAPSAPPAADTRPPVVPLVPTASSAPVGERVLQVPPWEIERSPWQPRTEFAEGPLNELADSIRANGVIEPIICRRRVDGKLELICGDEILEEILDRFGAAATITKCGEEPRFRMRTKAVVSDGLVSWVMQFADKIEVVEPRSLREQMKQRAEAVLAVYQRGTSAPDVAAQAEKAPAGEESE